MFRSGVKRLGRLLQKISIVSVVLLGGGLGPVAALADADESLQQRGGPPPGIQPIGGPIPTATPFPGESRLVSRADGTFAAVAEVRGMTKVFHIVGRTAPWTLRPGLTVMAKTYNGVVPGPTLVVRQGERVVINYRNELDIPDTIHLHGIHGIPPKWTACRDPRRRWSRHTGRFAMRSRLRNPGRSCTTRTIARSYSMPDSTAG